VAAVNGELPFEPKVTLIPRVRIARDEWDEKRARFDLAAYRRIPCIAAAKLTLVKPDFDARCPECFAYTVSRLCVLGGVA
jgi:hypothetical protein